MLVCFFLKVAAYSSSSESSMNKVVSGRVDGGGAGCST
jgi:hypothetical protein